MSKYDDLFDATAPDDSVFVDKGALDPLAGPDEIDHVQQDSNYEPSEFFYRLLRGEGKPKRDIELSVWLVSNDLLEVDLRLDSRVESAMSDEAVFFPPDGQEELELGVERVSIISTL